MKKCINNSQGCYSITDKGTKYADNLNKQIKPELYDYALKMVKWVKSKSFSQLIMIQSLSQIHTA